MNNKCASCLVGFGLGSVAGILLAPRAGASGRVAVERSVVSAMNAAKHFTIPFLRFR